MQTFVTDEQVVGSTTGVLFLMPQQGAVSANVILSNDGTNIITYDFQQSPDGFTWSDIQTVGSPLNNTLQVATQISIQVLSAYTQVRCIGSASGGSTLGFSIQRYFNRISGGNCPLIGGF